MRRAGAPFKIRDDLGVPQIQGVDTAVIWQRHTLQTHESGLSKRLGKGNCKKSQGHDIVKEVVKWGGRGVQWEEYFHSS